ncbi:MAG TPA: ATP-binding cassette domain-containing protein [Acidimicrobiales bacterium]|nr:ATP-binding cassette domain-containing protein [Acidimicrobiales bacterium]
MGTAIRAEELVKRFGSVHAVDGVSFDVAAGTVFGLLGPNGSGKTTIVRILATILHPDAGRAEVLGRDVVRQADEVRYLIGLAGQFAAIDPNLTGAENLRLTGRLAQLRGRVARERAYELLDRFQLSEAADRPARTYSGGMRRRLDVAAALVQRPAVVFLDEPTTGLDLHSRNELWDMIRELVAEGATVLLTTQYLEEADRLADRVAVMSVGRVIASDAPAALKAQLGNTVVEINLQHEVEAIRAAQLLTQATGTRTDREGTLLRLSSPDGTRVLLETVRSLNDNGIAPTTLTVREPSLDDVFLALTGQRTTTVGTDDALPVERTRR